MPPPTPSEMSPMRVSSSTTVSELDPKAINMRAACCSSSVCRGVSPAFFMTSAMSWSAFSMLPRRTSRRTFSVSSAPALKKPSLAMASPACAALSNRKPPASLLTRPVATPAALPVAPICPVVLVSAVCPARRPPTKSLLSKVISYSSFDMDDLLQHFSG